tara:strand:- start:389 stop:661 length:273 start_codon:yes stop_codon:yes gene_type:complete
VAENVKGRQAYIVVFWNGGREGDWKIFQIHSQAEQYQQHMSERWNTALVHTPEEARLLLNAVLPNHKKPRFKALVDKLLNKIGLKRWDGK